MWPGSQEEKWYHGRHWEEHCQKVEGADPAPALSSGEASPGVLYPVLGSSGQARHGAPGVMLAPNYYDDSAQTEVQTRPCAKISRMDFV